MFFKFYLFCNKHKLIFNRLHSRLLHHFMLQSRNKPIRAISLKDLKNLNDTTLHMLQISFINYVKF